MRHPVLAVVLVAVAAAAVGCRLPAAAPGGGKASPAATKSTKPAQTKASASPAARVAVALSGRVTLIADAKAGIVSDHGGGLVGNNGGGIISDQGGGVISNNSGSIVSDHGGGLVGNNSGSYRLKQALSGGPAAAGAAPLAIFALADAELTFTDAAGKPVLDAKGQPISARTDAAGAYALDATLPAGNVVAHVKLHAAAGAGAELTAMLPRAGAGKQTLDVGTASTFGAAFVLDRFVKGDQKVFDKLPRAESDALNRELDAARGWLGRAPSYQPAEMAAATDQLRGKVPLVAKAIEDVRALLLGQADLGNGRRGNEVPLANPGGLLADADGSLLIGEGYLGRVRKIAPDGTITTYMDAVNGTIKANVLRLSDLARGPDGTLWATSETTGIYRMKPGGGLELAFADLGKEGAGGFPVAIAVAPDETLYVGVSLDATFDVAAGGPGGGTASTAPAQIMAVAPGGTPKPIILDPAVKGGRAAGLVVDAAGTVYAGWQDADRHASVYKVVGGVATRLARFEDAQGAGDLARAADGKLYLSRPIGKRVVRIAADGTATPVAGVGGAAASAGLGRPGSLAVGPDGTLYVADPEEAVVHALGPDGAWRAVAGAATLIEEGETTNFAINQPLGLAWGEDGALYISESGSGRVRRYQAGKLTTVAGAGSGVGGDGGPARDALFDFPTGVARLPDGGMWIGELRGQRIRRVEPGGTVTTAVGPGQAAGALTPGQEAPATGAPAATYGLAVDRQGRVVYSSGVVRHQLLRHTPGAGGGTVRVLAGQPRADMGDVYSPAAYMLRVETDPAAGLGLPCQVAIGPDGDPYFAELVSCRVVRVVGSDGPGPVRLERVAGRGALGMVAAAGAFASDGTPVSPDNVPATECTLAFPAGLAFDAAGVMYIAEAGTLHLGAMATVAAGGNGGLDFSLLTGAGGGMPKVAGRVRRVGKDGIITTIAGRGGKWFPDDAGENALTAPGALAIAPDGRLAIADTAANMVRILPAGSY